MKNSSLKIDLNHEPGSVAAQIHKAAMILKSGGVVAYPTESCFGLGCQPKNYHAVQRILAIKHRASCKGLIVIANHIDQLLPYIKPLPDDLINKMISSWPGAVTWLVPAADWVPRWLIGKSDKIAIRIPGHKISRHLCKAAKMPLVSTSANRKGRSPLRDYRRFPDNMLTQLDYIVDTGVGVRRSTSTIIDITSKPSGAACRGPCCFSESLPSTCCNAKTVAAE